ncbi:uncharacterized protein LOC119175524 [Rhipicephalus microplus]|uniref:uncharacterized protein LOC119175524 n=1 Tax=Rhipicephalus microplus TaxID=6941 RepID=UPI003F6B1926
MQRIRLALLLLCAFASAFIVGVQLGLNMNHGPTDYSEQRPQHSSRITQQRTDSPYFTADGAERLDAWTKVSSNVYVYSAYLDPRLGPDATVVRVVGLARLSPALKVNYSCLIDDRPGKPAPPVVAKREFLQDHHHAKYDGVFITCPYRLTNDTETPQTIRVAVTGAETGTSKSIPVHYRRRTLGTHEMGSLSLCVRPFYGGVPKVHDLRHFVAYYSLHGVQRFTFYAYDSRDDVNDYLWTLRREGLTVDFFSWYLPGAKKSWALAQNAFTQDCLYRHANASRRVLIVDLDEYVFPLPVRGKPRTIAQLLAKVPESKACIVVRNVFWVRAASRMDRPFIFASLNRSRRVWPTGLRSKYFADPLEVLEGGIHFCRRFLPGGRNRDKQLTVSQALLFHYRGVRGETYARDTSMLVWKKPLMNSPLMRKPEFWRGVASKVRNVLRNSVDVVSRLIQR